MEAEDPNLRPDPPPAPPSLLRNPSINPEFTTSTTSSSSCSPHAFLRNVQAAFKRHRPLGMMPSNNIKPRRMFVPQRGTPKGSTLVTGSIFNTEKTEEESLLNQRLRDCKSDSRNTVSLVGETPEDASITPPTEWGSTTNTCEESSKQFGGHCNQPRYFAGCTNNDTVASAIMESEHVPPLEGPKKVHFATESDARFQGADESMATGIDDLLSHLDSLAFTEMEWDGSNQTDATTAVGHDLPHQSNQSEEVDENVRAKVEISSLRRTLGVSDQLHKFTNLIQNEMSQPMTRSSVVGLSCATTTLINPGSAPMLSSTTYCSEPHQASSSKINFGIISDVEMNYQSMVQPVMPPFDPPSSCISQLLNHQAANGGQVPSSTSKTSLEVKDHVLPDKESLVPKDSGTSHNPFPHGENAAIEIQKATQSEPPLSNVQAMDVKLETSKSGKQGKSGGGKAASSRKKTNDSDLFFKVNGKLYQRLGKIGSGGSSEVHKVISSECNIYALKKIKLKGRDNATAYGFCQEIEYLNKLKGKKNIIQLVDYEVTDKALLEEVISGSMSNKDGRVKEDGYIYMVLEYGEIDLAHMLSQKWKELDSSNSTIDENWLRFYWQQMLLAVNTIHEERIVHSDLKPANFLLVRGSLKLIDFGIAKAIMSDTTNIQRDSQVGTLSYMSPEAFMCNETDANGNTIKCGRPSDIWSLGCILYQMVYGRTPFSEYKTFWAKFKVITDPNHEIMYEPVSNPWLMDLMENCLAWDRNQRWRIPQLLQHPFLVPPLPPQVSMPTDQRYKLLQVIAKSCEDDPTALTMCSQLEQLLKNPRPSIKTQALIAHDELQKLFLDMSNLCLQLHKHLGKVEELQLLDA